jgi:GNAT superfamily N-acetyltransferase
MQIRQAVSEEYPAIIEHYLFCSYRGGIEPDDLAVIAAENDNIAGVVRICFEQGEKVLRGMYIKPAFRGNGLGKRMLSFLKETVDLHGCYCIPFSYLEGFYGSIGFRKINSDEAPGFLAGRYKKYAALWDRPMIMMRIL